MRATLCAGLAGLVLLMPRAAAANPDAPVLSDGRSVAMAGVGVATNDYASSVHQNPAGLASVDTFSATAAFTPILVGLSAPFTDPMTGETDTVDSDYQLGPLGMVAAGYRVHERVVVGLSASMFNGIGAHYQGALAGQDVKLQVGAGEVQVPVAVNITDALTVGAAYRMTFAMVNIETPMMLPPPAMGAANTETSLSGLSFLGFSLGARYRITEMFRVGVAYRSKVVVDMDGETDIATPMGSMTQDVEDEYALPHTFKLGTELLLFDDKLTVALDGTLWLYRESHDADPEANRPVAWDNSFGANLGLEYAATEIVAVRAGTSVFNSATPVAGASPFGVPPVLMHVVSAGAGFDLGPVVLDAGLAYMFAADKEVSRSENMQWPGTYGGDAFFGSLSVSYRM